MFESTCVESSKVNSTAVLCCSVIAATGILNGERANNPLYHDYNAVYAHYS